MSRFGDNFTKFSGVVPYLLVYFCVCQCSNSLSVSYINRTLTSNYHTLKARLHLLIYGSVVGWFEL